MTSPPGFPGTVPASVRAVVPSVPGATRLVLVRHGEATCNVSGVVGGRLGCTGLSTLGLEQAASLARRLAAHGELAAAKALYASVLPRALDTAATIAPAVGNGTLEVVADCDLCELHPGEGDGLTWEQFTARFGEPPWDDDPDVPLAPGGESWSGFVERAGGALEAVARRHPGEVVVVVCHAGVIEAALLRFVPIEKGARLRLRTDHTSLTEFESDPGGGAWRLLRYNDAAHLAG
ncbi:MAG TPA: histidine phosphatase family protein [Acidimicrobiales bacterium]|nr:histidine phosphatase family protein [Acidimicrobiales bacterium]